ncbi:MAG TPA: hypothetical protein ENJ19_11975 [Gammaproteobacteria bacterium]|nr:hypothetical protein [Gammaproteobacteria bacterium]
MTLVLTRVFQLVLALFFLSMVSVWFGGIALAVLSLWYQLSTGLGGHGAGALFLAALFGGGIGAGLYYLFKLVPQIFCAYVETGIALARLGMVQVSKLEQGLTAGDADNTTVNVTPRQNTSAS